MRLIRRLKDTGIAIKLIGIAVSFALPLAVLLFFMMKSINENIQFAEQEIKGDFYQKSLEAAIEAVGNEERLSYLAAVRKPVSQSELAAAFARTRQAFDQLEQTDRELGFALQFTDEGLQKRGRKNASYPVVRRKWESLHSLDGRERTPEAVNNGYPSLRADLRTMITHAGDNSNLILDPDLDTYYLMDVTLLALPEIQDQLTDIVLLSEKYQESGLPSLQDQLYLASVISLLNKNVERVNQSVKNALIEDPNFYDVQPALAPTIEPELGKFNESAAALISLLQTISQAPTGTAVGPELIEAGLQTRAVSFSLWHTVVPQLNEMLEKRKNYYRSQMLGALVMAGTALLIAALFVFWITRSILFSLHSLQRKAREIAAGNYEARVEVGSRDEIGQLALDFNIMADKIQEYNINLEKIVKTRTAELEKACQELKQLDELKSNFLSSVSHELRTPLTSVLGFAKIIRKRLSDVLLPVIADKDAKVQRAFKQVSDNTNIILIEGERLTNLINDVLDLAKMEAGKMDIKQDPVALGELIEHAGAATAALFEQKQLAFLTEVEPNLPLLKGDSDRLIQVLINLISNAVKFTEKGSITCTVLTRSHEIIVSVVDTGIGISAEDQKKVFDKFKQVGDTLTDKPKGTGLGLPICQQIIELHRGRIWVTSELGKGSRFSFALPIDGQQQKNVPKPRYTEEDSAPAVEAAEDKRSTILLVDDEQNIRTLLRQELEEAGYHIEEAANGKEALRKIERKQPALIILDIMMPELNGFDLAAILKSNPGTWHIPIVILSILNDRRRASQLGVDQYLSKPVQMERLLAVVGSLLSRDGSPKSIMVIDNEEPTAGLVLRILKSRGYAVVDAYETQEQIRELIAQPERNRETTCLYPDAAQVEKAVCCENEQKCVIVVLFCKLSEKSGELQQKKLHYSDEKAGIKL